MRLLHTWSQWDISPHADFSQLLPGPYFTSTLSWRCGGIVLRDSPEGWRGLAGTRNSLRRGWGVSRRYFSEEKICAVFRGLEDGRGRRGRPGRAATQTVRRHAAAAAADRGDLSVLQRHWLRWEEARSRPCAVAVRGHCTVAQSPQSMRENVREERKSFVFFPGNRKCCN